MTAAILPLTKGHIKSYEKSSHLFSKKELGPQFVLYQEIQETVILKIIKKDIWILILTSPASLNPIIKREHHMACMISHVVLCVCMCFVFIPNKLGLRFQSNK